MSLYRRARLALSRGTSSELQPVNQAAIDADRDEKRRAEDRRLTHNVFGQPIAEVKAHRAAAEQPPQVHGYPGLSSPPRPPQGITVVVNNSPGAIVHVDASQRITGPGVARPRRRVTERTTRETTTRETTERTIEE